MGGGSLFVKQAAQGTYALRLSLSGLPPRRKIGEQRFLEAGQRVSLGWESIQPLTNLRMLLGQCLSQGQGVIAVAPFSRTDDAGRSGQ